MGWATKSIEKLNNGEAVIICPKGNSMKGKIESGTLVKVNPITSETKIIVGDIVLCKVHGSEYLHLVKAIRPDGTYQIANNRGHINGWIGKNNIFGIFAGFVKK